MSDAVESKAPLWALVVAPHGEDVPQMLLAEGGTGPRADEIWDSAVLDFGIEADLFPFGPCTLGTGIFVWEGDRTERVQDEVTFQNWEGTWRRATDDEVLRWLRISEKL